MKRLVIFVVCSMLLMQVVPQDQKTGLRFGIQVSSDSFAGLMLYSDFIEASLKAQTQQTDGQASVAPVLVLGGHAAYVMNPFNDSTALTAGIELRSGFGTGDINYAEYIDAGIRLGVNYQLGNHVLLSGILYPIWSSSREIENADDWGQVVTIPSAAVAVSFLF